MAQASTLNNYALSMLSSLLSELLDEKSALRQDIAPCGDLHIQSLISLTQSISTGQTSEDYSERLIRMADNSHEEIKKSGGLYAWRRLYGETLLIYSLMNCLSGCPISMRKLDGAIARLDMIIIIAGAPGIDRLDIILGIIKKIQEVHFPAISYRQKDCFLPTLPTTVSSTANAGQSIPCLPDIPSLSAFLGKYHHKPFILRGFADGWPAVAEHKWASKSYLKSIAGRGRIVPIEVGSDYRTEEWSQELMPWDAFLDYLFPEEGSDSTREHDVLYLAQHNLFKQFPMLEEDIVLPDYVYSELQPPDYFPSYRPPANQDALIKNVWLGPEKTVSPAHTDPYFNFYVQVVGYKTVWLAPPQVSSSMSPFSRSAQASATGPSIHHPALNQANPILSNTSRIDVFTDLTPERIDASAEGSSLLKAFRDTVIPEASSATLGPGDMLFFPPGWWHAMRAERTSFSVSMWF